jgi:hypothetical protein
MLVKQTGRGRQRGDAEMAEWLRVDVRDRVCEPAGMEGR